MLPLEGIHVLDVASMMAGPYGATLLADMGADVIKLEPPTGDEARSMSPARGPDSAMFVGLNRNKRSLAVDLRTEGGRRVLQALAKWSDVVIDNHRERARRRLGLDAETLRMLNPRLITIFVSTFGETGPLAKRPGIDPLAQALTGLMSVTGEPDGRPLKAGPPVGDATASLLVAYSAMVALWARERTGEGQDVEVPLINGLIHIQSPYILQYLLFDRIYPRMGNASEWYGPYESYRCADGKYVQIGCYNDKFFGGFCKAIGRPELAMNSDFATNDQRLRNRERLDVIIAEFFSGRARSEALETLSQYDVIFAPVNDYSEVFREPQVLHNGMLQEVEHAALGTVRITGVPMKFASTPGSVRRPPPALGQHSQEVLRELGFSEEDRHRLAEEGAVTRGVGGQTASS